MFFAYVIDFVFFCFWINNSFVYVHFDPIVGQNAFCNLGVDKEFLLLVFLLDWLPFELWWEPNLYSLLFSQLEFVFWIVWMIPSGFELICSLIGYYYSESWQPRVSLRRILKCISKSLASLLHFRTWTINFVTKLFD